MDRVLTLNVGSSSLKWSLFDEGEHRIDGGSTSSVDEIARRIGDVDGVVHRIVHGGERFVAPAIIDARVRKALEDVAALAPLHMWPALAVLDSARARWTRAIHVAAFDTAFHKTLPKEESTYAVPAEWRVRRYGFHGLSVEYVASCVRERRVLVFHLGSGSSITALLDGKSVATTMGMTPLEGPVMGTRAGSIDPGALLDLMRRGYSRADLEDGLTRKGGLVALCGRSGMLEIAQAATEGDERAAFARVHWIRSVAKNACSLLPALGGLDASVFTGGIGENDADARDRIARQLPLGAPVHVIQAREDISLVRAGRLATCNQLHHAPPQTHPRRDRLQ